MQTEEVQASVDRVLLCIEVYINRLLSDSKNTQLYIYQEGTWT